MTGVPVLKYPEALMMVTQLLKRNAILKIIDKHRVPLDNPTQGSAYRPLDTETSIAMMEEISDLISSSLDYLKK